MASPKRQPDQRAHAQGQSQFQSDKRRAALSNVDVSRAKPAHQNTVPKKPASKDNEGGGSWLFGDAGGSLASLIKGVAAYYATTISWTYAVSPWLASIGFGGWWSLIPIVLGGSIIPWLASGIASYKSRREAYQNVQSMIDQSRKMLERGSLTEQNYKKLMILLNEYDKKNSELQKLALTIYERQQAPLPAQAAQIQLLVEETTKLMGSARAILGMRYSEREVIEKYMRNAKNENLSPDKKRIIDDMLNQNSNLQNRGQARRPTMYA